MGCGRPRRLSEGFHMRSPLLALLCLALPTTAVAAQADQKIGYVDVSKALNDVEDGKTAKAKLQSDFTDKQKKLDAMQNDLKAKKDEFDKKATMMEAGVKQQK